LGTSALCNEATNNSNSNNNNNNYYKNLNKDNCIWAKEDINSIDDNGSCLDGDTIFNDCGRFVDPETCEDKLIILGNSSKRVCSWNSNNNECTITASCINYESADECNSDIYKSSNNPSRVGYCIWGKTTDENSSVTTNEGCLDKRKVTNCLQLIDEVSCGNSEACPGLCVWSDNKSNYK
jgi:hypothetical protein